MVNKPSSIKDVARLAGVSAATVSYVLNQTKPVAPETRERVMRAIQELRYLPNQAARDLKTQHSGLVGAVVPDLQSRYFARLAAVAEEELSKYGFKTVVCNSNGSAEKEERFLASVRSRLEGLLIVPAESGTSRLFLEWDQGECPVVFVDRRPVPEDLAPYVVSDNERAGREAFCHLAERYPSLALIAPVPAPVSVQDRIAGFMAAAIAAKRPVLTAWQGPESGRLAGRGQMERILAQRLGGAERDASGPGGRGAGERRDPYSSGGTGDDALGVYCTTNSVAVGCVLTLRAHGVRIGDEAGVLSHDEEDWQLLCQPTVSTVHTDPELLARRAVQILMRRRENPPMKERFVLPTQLVIRLSTVRSEDADD